MKKAMTNYDRLATDRDCAEGWNLRDGVAAVVARNRFVFQVVLNYI
jgi:hypothetical protein